MQDLCGDLAAVFGRLAQLVLRLFVDSTVGTFYKNINEDISTKYILFPQCEMIINDACSNQLAGSKWRIDEKGIKGLNSDTFMQSAINFSRLQLEFFKTIILICLSSQVIFSDSLL